MVGTTNKDFLIRVKADLSDTLSKLDRLEKELLQNDKAANKTRQGVGGLSGQMGFLTRALGAYFSLRTAQRLIQQADAFNTLQDRIKTATREFGDYNTVSRELFNISQRSGTALESNVELFQRIARAAPELKATQEEVLAVTQAVNQLGVISGASSEQLKFGLLQLSQAFSSDIVRAEELNSVLENIPEVANRMAAGMGLTVGEMRKLVIEGKLASKDVFASLLGQTQEINAEFQELPQRVGRSAQRMATSFAQLLATLDNSTSATQRLAEFMNRLSHDFDSLNGRLMSAPSPFANWELPQVDAELARVNARLAEIDRLNRMNLSQSIALPQDRLAEEQELVKTRAQLLELQQKLNTAEDAGEGDGDEPVSAAQLRAEEAINKTIEALELQQATLGKTRSEAVLYELALHGATEAQLQQARTALDAIDAHEQMVETQKRVKEIIEATRTPAEQLAAAVAELNDLYTAGAFGAVGSAEAMETLRRGIANAREEVKGLAKDGKQAFDGELNAAIRGWGDTFTDTLTNMVVTGKGSFRELANAIIRDLVRIFIQTQITLPALQAMGLVSAPTPAAGASVPVPVQHGGGRAGSGPMRMDSPLAYLNAPRFHAGTPFVGLRPGERRAILEDGERVLSREQNKMFSTGLAMGGAAGPMAITLNIENKGTPQQATNAAGQFDGKQFVINVITEDQQRNGPVTQGFSRTFSLKRSPG